MNFFAHQDHARTRTRHLLIAFVLALLAISAGVYFLLLGLSAVTTAGYRTEPSPWLRPDLALISLFSVAAVVGFATFVKIKSLGAGGSDVAESVGGRRVQAGTTDPYERRLMNVVEEMAIASGVPVPAVYVLNDEVGINAFAAGYSAGDAAIAVTRGALHILDRAELQAVVAHEFSHILNGDMRLNVRLIGVLFGLMMIGSTGGWLVRLALVRPASRHRDNSVPLVVAAGACLWLIGSVGVFAGRVIQRAVSRQREFLADASAVQFTRDRAAMAGALRKIGGYASGARVRARGADELSHMFFGEAITHGLSGMLATHPPLEERIRRVEPSWDGRFPSIAAPDTLYASVEPVGLAALAAGAGGALAMDLGISQQVAPPPPYRPQGPLSDTVGTTTPAHLDYSGAILDAIPEPFRAATRSSLGAVALVYTLLLDNDDSAARTQLHALAAMTHPDILHEVYTLAPLRFGLDPRARLPLIELSVTALRELSPDQYASFRADMDALVTADGRLSLFEFSVQRCLTLWLDAAFGLRVRRPVQYFSMRGIRDPMSCVLSALAYIGARDHGAAMHAFQRGAAELRLLQPGDARLLAPEYCGFDAVDNALEIVGAAAPAIKQSFIDACAATTLADGELTVSEAELLRAIAEAIGCPVPPFLPNAGAFQPSEAAES